MLGAAGDRPTAEAVRRGIARGRQIDTVGRIDLLTAYACLKRVRLFIGNDSGLMHLAAAAGAPTLGLFGPSDDRLYAPWGEYARTLRGPRDFETFKRLDPELNQAVCHMFDLPVPWVTKAARALLEDTDRLFTPAGLPDLPPALAAPQAPAIDQVPSEPSFLFTAPPKPPRKSRAKPKPATTMTEPEPEPAAMPAAESGVETGGDAVSHVADGANHGEA
jgi:hypothetical protein